MKLKRKFGLVIYFIPIVFLVVLLMLEINFARNEVKTDGLAYREKSDISYKVKLKENGYYEDEYLGEQFNVVASLIDMIVVDYSYINTFSSNVDYNVKYSVTADLVIYDANADEKPIDTKTYTLVEKKEVSGNGLMAKFDLTNQDINYNEYNALVEQWKKEVIPSANLIVKFNTDFTGKSDILDDEIKSVKTSTLTIPVSKRTINVDIKKNNNSKEEVLSVKRKLSIFTKVLIVMTIIVLIIIIIKYILYVISSAKRKSKYDMAVEKILREFDRAITEAKGKLRLDKNANMIQVKDFMELLDVHDNFNIPIIYYKINSHECLFLVKNQDDYYYNIMRSDDFK